jgi:hypothetical protein
MVNFTNTLHLLELSLDQSQWAEASIERGSATWIGVGFFQNTSNLTSQIYSINPPYSSSSSVQARKHSKNISFGNTVDRIQQHDPLLLRSYMLIRQTISEK